MSRLTSRSEFIVAIVLVALGAVNIFVAQATGFEIFPRRFARYSWAATGAAMRTAKLNSLTTARITSPVRENPSNA